MSVPLRAVQLNEANAFLKKHPEVLYVDLLIADMNGVVRGKRIERTSLHKVYEKGINLPASLFALDINGSTVESTGLGLDIGDAVYALGNPCRPFCSPRCKNNDFGAWASEAYGVAVIVKDGDIQAILRKVQPAVKPFHIYSPDINPAIEAEFAKLAESFAFTEIAADQGAKLLACPVRCGR